MKRLILLFAVLLAVPFFVSCGDGSSGTPAPTPAAPEAKSKWKCDGCQKTGEAAAAPEC